LEAGCSGDVVDDVVRASRVATDAGWDVIEFEAVAGAPGDVVVSAAYSKGPRGRNVITRR